MSPGGTEGRGLDARLLPRADLEQLDVEAAPLGPAHLHAQDHLGPVLGVGAAGAGVDGDERVARVVVAGEQPLLLERAQPRLDGRDRLLELVGELRVLVGELGEPLEILGVGPRASVKSSSRRCVRACSAPTFAAASGSSQKPRLAHLRLERAQALTQVSWVKDSPRAGTSAHGLR